jgi:non-ribosomal peptide synthetase component E (peptide arylation enzyme)
MLSTSRVWLSHRSLYPSIIRLSDRFSSTSAKVAIPPPKLTQSYYHHASEIPFLYHTLGQHLDKLAIEYPNQECYAFKGERNKRYTYKSFLDEVDSLTTSLIELGFEKNDRLAVWLPNTSENCALTYAASKVGVIKVMNFIFNKIIFIDFYYRLI